MGKRGRSDATEKPWVEVEVHNWRELQDQLHQTELIPPQPAAGFHRRANYVFRGMDNASWELKTSLERLGSVVEAVEVPALRAFRKYAPQGTFRRESVWEALAVAQHNRLPTRLLDWTASPLVAAHFAVWDRKEWKADGVVWCVDTKVLRERLPQQLLAILRQERAWLFDCRMLDTAFPQLEELDRTTAEDGDFLVFLEPPSIDARIANQFGLLSMMNGASKSHHDHLREMAKRFPGSIRRIIIRSEAKTEIRDLLDQNNITERMLFPGLPGLCDWLKRYYGPA
jgi:hypothetical protein